MARNKDRKLFLYLGKPIRSATVFCGNIDEGVYIMTHNYFENFGLNENDYKDLKWEDEPVEVFVNMEDWIMTREELIKKAYRDSEKSGREYERVVKYVESILKEE